MKASRFKGLGRQIKIDNRALGPKVALRRYFLDRYHAAGSTSPVKPIVFDACMGRGIIWKRLRADYDVTYWGVDLKRAPGRLGIDSERVLAQPGWPFDVIDIDTYGSPWGHWLALLPNVTRPVTVFLTMGALNGGTPVTDSTLQVVGMTPTFLATLQRQCSSLKWNLGELVIQRSLSVSEEYGLRIVEAQRSRSQSRTSGSKAWYFGVRLEPIGDG